MILPETYQKNHPFWLPKNADVQGPEHHGKGGEGGAAHGQSQ